MKVHINKGKHSSRNRTILKIYASKHGAPNYIKKCPTVIKSTERHQRAQKVQQYWGLQYSLSPVYIVIQTKNQQRKIRIDKHHKNEN
jgi:hypothetical protein